MTTEQAIKNLDDTRARQILAAITRRHLAQGSAPQLTSDLRDELASVFDLTSAPVQPASEAELAQQALLVLAEDPATRAAIESMAAQPSTALQKFDLGASLGITAAILIVLQTHVNFERRKDGAWSLKLEKKPTSEALLKGLVQKLLGFTK